MKPKPLNGLLSHSPEETRRVAQAFAKHLKAGDVIGLVRKLGAGKAMLQPKSFTHF